MRFWGLRPKTDPIEPQVVARLVLTPADQQTLTRWLHADNTDQFARCLMPLSEDVYVTYTEDTAVLFFSLQLAKVCHDLNLFSSSDGVTTSDIALISADVERLTVIRNRLLESYHELRG